MSRKALPAITFAIGLSFAVGAVAATRTPKTPAAKTPAAKTPAAKTPASSSAAPKNFTAGNTDFTLKPLPEVFLPGKGGTAQVQIPKGTTFYDFMRDTLKKDMEGTQSKENDDDLVKEGKGYAVTLNSTNSNIHVNYYNSSQSGRSYGWTNGEVGDWSDRSYLTNIWSVVHPGSDGELSKFYTTLVSLVGSCDPSPLSGLSGMTERVATNFLAIYGAEEYRATLGTRNWDDALFDVSLLAAFHGGQEKVMLYYMGEFDEQTKRQAPGVFNDHGKPTVNGVDKAADITDYWQYSANAQVHNSGINETRIDFSKMGQMITKYYTSRKGDSSTVDAIEQIVSDRGENVFEDITQHFATGSSKTSETASLANLVSKFMVQIHTDARDITQWIVAQEGGKSSDDASATESSSNTQVRSKATRTPRRPARPAPAQ